MYNLDLLYIYIIKYRQVHAMMEACMYSPPKPWTQPANIKKNEWGIIYKNVRTVRRSSLYGIGLIMAHRIVL